MTSYGHESNLVEDEYVDQDEDGLDDFIVESDDDDNVVVEEQEQSEEEEEEEEAPVGQQVILSLREQLKAEVRRKNQAIGAAAGKVSCSSSVQAAVNDRFGTFFGPSKPSLARRVIEEGCSSIMKEIQNVPSRRDAVPLVSKAQPNASGHQQKPKPVSEEKRKVDTLRQNRDYSDLFSDDADITLPAKEQPDNMLALPPRSDCEPMHSAGKSKVFTSRNQPARLPKDHGLKVAPSSIQRHVQSKADSQGKEHLPNRKGIIAAAKNGPSLPAMKKTPGLQSSNGQKPQQSLQSTRPQPLLPGQRRQQSSQSQRLQQSSQNQGQQSHGPQSFQSRKPKPFFQGQHSGQKVSVQSHDRSKFAEKQLGPSSKPKTSRPISSNAVFDHAKKRRAVNRKSDDEFDHGKISSMIRGMFNYNPEKYMGRDEDDSNMEADYRSIQMEERRSAKLARKEDEEQFRLIQEEERRERERKRKMSAHKQ